MRRGRETVPRGKALRSCLQGVAYFAFALLILGACATGSSPADGGIGGGSSAGSGSAGVSASASTVDGESANDDDGPANGDGGPSADGGTQGAGSPGQLEPPAGAAVTAPVQLRLGSPRGVGAISLASWLEITTLPDVYDGAPFALELVGSPDQLTAKLATGELDAALLPVNLAASLYNHTDGAVQIAAITGLGSIYGITNDPKINSFADLSDASVISFGLGATPQFAIDYLANSLPDFLVVEYASEAPEAVAQLVAGQASVGILPEPFVTSVLEQAPEFRIAFSLGDLWLEDTGSPLVSTALVFRRAWADEHPETARALIDKVRESSSFVNDNPAAAAAIVAGRDILPNIEIAQAAIPRLNLVTMTGPEMRTATLDFLATLHNFSPAAIGGDVPGDDFFFE